MKLHKFHVQQFGAGFVGERHPVGGVFPRIRSNFPSFADAAGSDDNGLRLESDKAPLLAPIAERTCDTLAVFDKPRDRTFHEHVDALLHAAVLQGSNQLEPSAVTYVA